jgi:hypothetical protein
MNIGKVIKSNIAKFLKVNNSMSLPSLFLKYGSRGTPMLPDWTEVMMSDKDHYTGYGYAAIKIRANMVAKTALNYVKTESKKKEFTHPYLDVIDKSKSFSNYQFWNDISTFLDLEGIYFLMAVRAVDGSRISKIKEFKLLNPYNVKRVMSKDSLEVAGYIETRKGFVREIPKEMIIEMRELNPFSPDDPMSMTDAAKEAQFTLKTAGDYTRNALRGNINAAGILSTDVALEKEDFEKFVDRVKKHTKGEPIFGNGSGSIKWEGMQTELSKAALADVNEINRDSLFAVSGVSKTIMGIEQSGVTRETSRTQKELIMENQILPRIQLIIDALNLDYQNTTGDTDTEIVVDNPLEVDIDAEIKEIERDTNELELYQTLINKGIKKDVAVAYVNGDVGIEALDLEKSDPIIPPDAKKKDETENSICEHCQEEEKRFNQVGGGIIQQEQASLQNSIINIDSQLLINALKRLPSKIKNAQTIEGELITETEKKNTIGDLVLVLTGFYGIIMTLIGNETTKDRSNTYSLTGSFLLNADVKAYIKETAKKVAESHVATVSNDIFGFAQKAALEGLSVPQIESKLKAQFTYQMTELRAKTIARTETNRAFTRAQFEADIQFVKENDLVAFKKWVTRSGNPCAFCQALASEPAIPLGKSFRNIGASVSAGKEVFDVDFETAEAGNLHPNCQCSYELIIEKPKNSIDMETVKETIDKNNDLIEEIKADRIKLENARKNLGKKKESKK